MCARVRRSGRCRCRSNRSMRGRMWGSFSNVGRSRRGRFATQANAKSFVLEFELGEPVIAQQRDQLAQLLHVHGRRWPLRGTRATVWSFTLFFGSRHISFPQSRKGAKNSLCAFAPLREILNPRSRRSSVLP